MQHSPSLLRSVFSQLAIFAVLTLSITGAWAAYVTLAPGSIATGQPVNAALMQQIKDNLDDLNTRVGATASVPAGAIMAYNLASCPSGWIAANGSSGTPDLRGEFIRGLDSGRGVDTGRALGTTQADEFKSHTHNSSVYAPGGAAAYLATTYNAYFSAASQVTGAAGGTETRPRNVALLYCMKQ